MTNVIRVKTRKYNSSVENARRIDIGVYGIDFYANLPDFAPDVLVDYSGVTAEQRRADDAIVEKEIARQRAAMDEYLKREMKGVDEVAENIEAERKLPKGSPKPYHAEGARLIAHFIREEAQERRLRAREKENRKYRQSKT